MKAVIRIEGFKVFVNISKGPKGLFHGRVVVHEGLSEKVHFFETTTASRLELWMRLMEYATEQVKRLLEAAA